MRLLLGTTKLTPCSIMKRPTMRVWARSKTSTTAPSRRPRRSMPSTQASARSLCSTARICLGERNRSSPPSSGMRKPKPIGVTDDAAADQIHLLRQTVIALAIDDELAVALHGAQAAAQGLEVFLGGEAEGRGDLFERFGPALLGQ